MSILTKLKNLFKKDKQQTEQRIKQDTKPQVSNKQVKKKPKLSKEEKERRANKLLKEQLKKAEQEQFLKEQKAKKSKEKQISKQKNNTDSNIQKSKNTPITKQEESKEKLAKQLATKDNTILFISATTKRLKVVEWRNLKEKTLLNKEREIRHTHKGGWSQEKFQRFVDFQKSRTLDWVESNLNKEGVLRPPYTKIIVEADNEELEKQIEELMIKNLI